MIQAVNDVSFKIGKGELFGLHIVITLGRSLTNFLSLVLNAALQLKDFHLHRLISVNGQVDA